MGYSFPYSRQVRTFREGIIGLLPVLWTRGYGVAPRVGLLAKLKYCAVFTHAGIDPWRAVGCRWKEGVHAQ